MNVKIKELKTKLTKSPNRTMLIAGICGDDLLIAKALDANQRDVFKLIDKYTKELKDVSEEDRGDIANNAIVALKELSKGKESIDRVKLFIEAFTSLTFESKDELTLDDYCHAVCMIRLLEKEILPESKIIKTQYSRNPIRKKVKNFTAGNKGSDAIKENFLEKEVQTAIHWMGSVDCLSEDDKKKMDEDEQKCSELILETINKDTYLNNQYGCRSKQFSNWIAEQLYGLKVEIVNAIATINDDRSLVKDLFEQYIAWVKANDPNGYIDYLRDSTSDSSESSTDAESAPSENNNECYSFVLVDTPQEEEPKTTNDSPMEKKETAQCVLYVPKVESTTESSTSESTEQSSEKKTESSTTTNNSNPSDSKESSTKKEDSSSEKKTESSTGESKQEQEQSSSKGETRRQVYAQYVGGFPDVSEISRRVGLDKTLELLTRKRA